MALLTPPHSSSKENTARFAFTVPLKVDVVKMQASGASTSSPTVPTPLSASRSVVWSPHNSYHSLNTPAKTPPTAASTNAWVKDRPVRSILKARAQPLADSTNSPRASTSKPTPADVTDLSNLPEDLDTFFRKREATPEPSEPLTDLEYLHYPVSLIVKEGAKPREIIEGYSVLAARLRTNVQFSTEADASWPLFQPLRKQRTRFVECVVRDLGRARVDPINTLECPASEEEEVAMKEWAEEDDGENAALPSPQRSPKKPKKKGMTAAQVKYARDLCTICHAAIKLLCMVFSIPATFSVFEDNELKAMLNAALAIPLAESLPTPNARKTCALVILLLQTQRLPESVTFAARDRIGQSLKRGVAGELGKEGKKGSANDGLKAIHDLSLFQPKVFIPLFTTPMFLRAILQNLLAPTLALRVQACHALGGVAYALAALPPSSMHATVSDIVLDYVMIPSPATPTKTGKLTPSLPPKDSAIIRTLRTTIAITDATHIAQSPVWAISVLASLIVLVGSRMYTRKKACVTILNVLKAGYKSKKPSIRCLASMAWRALTWTWFQPDYDTFPSHEDGEDERTDSDSEDSVRRQDRDETKDKMREMFFTLLHEYTDLQMGLTTVVTFLNCSPPSTAKTMDNDSLHRALKIIQCMAESKHPDTINDAAQVLLNMLTPSDSSSRSPSPLTTSHSFSHAILPSGLFSSHPTTGILSADVTGGNSVMTAVKPMFDKLPNLDFVPVLSRDTQRDPWVWAKITKIWRKILGEVEMEDQVELPEELARVWEGLVLAQLGSGDEGEDEEIAQQRVEAVVDVLIGILEDSNIDFTLKDEESTLLASSTSKVPFPSTDSAETPTSSSPSKHTRHELKIKVVKKLFAALKTVASKDQLAGLPLAKLFACLVDPRNVVEWTMSRFTSPAPAPSRKRQRTSGLTSSLSLSHSVSLSSWAGISAAASSSGPPSKEVLAPITAWTSLVVSVMSIAEGEAAKDMMKAFWGMDLLSEDGEESQSIVSAWNSEVKASVWKTAVSAWRKNEAAWDGAVVLLAAPFASFSPHACSAQKGMWAFSQEERERWVELQKYAVEKAGDFGFDCVDVVDGVAEIMLAAKDAMLLAIGGSEGVASPTSTPKSSVSASSSIMCSSDAVAASLIQISDLLLEQLNLSFALARDLPASLILLVSETMTLTYPVSPVNTTMATWLPASIAQAVEKCPESLVKGFVEGLSDGLAVWLADESESWVDYVLDNTFVPLYENILLCIKDIPEDLDFLAKISPFLESVFSGARVMPPGVMASFKAAFELFWEGGPYSKIEEPAGGWPLNVTRCLGLEEIVPVTVSLPLEADAEEPLAAPATPKQASRKLDSTGMLRTPMAAMNGLSHIPSPHRPHKASVDNAAPFPLPTSPVSPVRRRRRTSSSSTFGSGLGLSALFGTGPLGLAPGLEIVESPSKRRRLTSGEEDDFECRENKENSSPLRGRSVGFSSPFRAGKIAAPLFETVTDRIAGEESKKKKRKMRDRMGVRKPQPQQQRRDPSPAESVASTSSVRNNEEDEEWVAKALVPFPSVEDSPAPVEVESVPAKKRKRMTMEAVVLPLTVNGQPASIRRRKLEHASSFESMLHASSPGSSGPATPPRSQEELKTPAAKKRKRSSSMTFIGRPPIATTTDEDPFEVEVSAVAVLPALIISSSRSTSYIEEKIEVVEEPVQIPSSDDDPRYGQVTPHHIISPPLAHKAGKVYMSKGKQSAPSIEGVDDGHRHVSFQEAEGRSDDDDSMVEPGSSPSKKVAERRMLQKQNSLTKEGEALGRLNPVLKW